MGRAYTNVYDVYDVQKSRFIILNENSQKVTEIIGVPAGKISTYSINGFLYRGRYRIVNKTITKSKKPVLHEEKIIVMDEFKTAWSKEWDRVRQDKYLWKTIDNNLLGDYAEQFK